ncbi:MAG: hypothetical protein HRT94_02960 [Alphaproteobacteria bacterium]|nr:hypothetical protein [Alphaproteobacteria bacterium]
MTFIVLYFSLVHTNFNLPVYQQYFASKFFVPVETEYAKNRQNFACIVSNCIPSFSIYRKNKTACDGGVTITDYTYTVSGKKYDVTRYSYLRTRFCNALVLKAYYFPLYPKWSVLDPSFPKGEFLADFEKTSRILIILWFFYLILSMAALRGRTNLQSLILDVQKDSRIFVLSCAVFYPFIITAILFLFSVLDLFSSWWRTVNIVRDYKEVLDVLWAGMLYAFIYLPSVVLFFKSIGIKSKLGCFLALVATILIFYVHGVAQNMLRVIF